MTRYIIGGLIVVVFIAWGAMAFLKTTIQYVSIEESLTADHIVQVMGQIDFDLVNYNVDESRLEFAIFDVDATDPANAFRLPVRYHGIVPGNFDQATSVVVKGQAEEGVFVAEQILVKCPSKYQGEDPNEYQDMKRHQEAADLVESEMGK